MSTFLLYYYKLRCDQVLKVWQFFKRINYLRTLFLTDEPRFITETLFLEEKPYFPALNAESQTIGV